MSICWSPPRSPEFLAGAPKGTLPSLPALIAQSTERSIDPH
jgi:hypothetical protein